MPHCHLQWSAERVLVTGASGFIGSFLVETLVRRGAAVHCLLRPSSSTQRLRAVLDHVQIHRADLTEPESLATATAAARPTTIFHLAATGATNIHVSPLWATQVNVEGTLNLLQALDGDYRVLVNTGTCHEYGDNPPPFRENQDPRPELPYAIEQTLGVSAPKVLPVTIGAALVIDHFCPQFLIICGRISFPGLLAGQKHERDRQDQCQDPEIRTSSVTFHGAFYL